MGRGLRGLLYALTAFIVLLAAAGIWVFTGHSTMPFLSGAKARVTYGISLVPDATGTAVEIIGETSDVLPSRVELRLALKDNATLANGGPASDSRLFYSDVRDGLGNTLPAEQVRSGVLRDVGTDGRRLSLSFHVQSVDGLRVVYPIPQSPDLTWAQARVYPQGGTLTCWASGQDQDSAFAGCESQQGDFIDGSRHASVRLVIKPADSA